MKSSISLFLTLLSFNLSILSQEDSWFHVNNPEKTQTMTALEYCQYASQSGNGFPWIDNTSSYDEIKKAAYIYNTYKIYFPSGILDKCLGESYFKHEENWYETSLLLTNDSLYHFGEQSLLFVRKNKKEEYRLYFYKIIKPDPFSEEAELSRRKNIQNPDSIFINVENVLMKNPDEGNIAIISISLLPKDILEFEDVSLEYMTIEESALESIDYEPISGKILFTNKFPNKIWILKIKILADSVKEEKETFMLKFINPKNAVLKTDFIRFTINGENR